MMDRAYIDYKRLYSLTKRHINFVVRAKRDITCKVIHSNATDAEAGILKDDKIVLTGSKTSKRYPKHLRMVRFYDDEQERILVFLTNNFKLSATTVAQLYKSRWGIELFFRWIKPHLKVKTFWGQSENAVKTQIRIAISSYVLVAIAKKQLKLKSSLYEILQLISLSVSILPDTHI